MICLYQFKNITKAHDKYLTSNDLSLANNNTLLPYQLKNFY